jgi:hypothetical protein
MRRFYVKAAPAGTNSYHVMERDRRNDFGEPFCVAPDLTYEQARVEADRLNDEAARAKAAS